MLTQTVATSTRNERVCVILMTYGSPASLDNSPEYLRNIRGGREPDDALVAELAGLREGRWMFCYQR